MCVYTYDRLARELAEKEDAHLTLEDQYTSLQEEVEVKTKKLKKLWNKWQAANREVTDLQVRSFLILVRWMSE
jgi:kinesin family protein 3/17